MQIKSDNVFEDEIEANGLPKFYWAFTHNELDYFSFIHSLISNRQKKFFKPVSTAYLSRNIVAEQPELKKM
jgi:hypothetical protein